MLHIRSSKVGGQTWFISPFITLQFPNFFGPFYQYFPGNILERRGENWTSAEISQFQLSCSSSIFDRNISVPSITQLKSSCNCEFEFSGVFSTVNNCRPYRHSIDKCFSFFHIHSSDKIYSLYLYHLLNFTLHFKANACNIGTCFRFYTQMQVENNNKAFAYRIYSHFTQQCPIGNHFYPKLHIKLML